MIPENMVEIKDFEGYFITNDGRIFSLKRYKKLTEMILKEDKDGYYEIGIYKNKKRYFRRIHRLVAKAYIPNPYHLPQINHKNGNKKDNHVENLEWITNSDNIRHSFDVLNRNPNISTNKQIKLIRKENDEVLIFNSIKDCAYYLRMSHEHLGRLISGKLDISNSKKLKPYIITLL